VVAFVVAVAVEMLKSALGKEDTMEKKNWMARFTRSPLVVSLSVVGATISDVVAGACQPT